MRCNRWSNNAWQGATSESRTWCPIANVLSLQLSWHWYATRTTFVVSVHCKFKCSLSCIKMINGSLLNEGMLMLACEIYTGLSDSWSSYWVLGFPARQATDIPFPADLASKSCFRNQSGAHCDVHTCYEGQLAPFVVLLTFDLSLVGLNFYFTHTLSPLFVVSRVCWMPKLAISSGHFNLVMRRSHIRSTLLLTMPLPRASVIMD